MNQSSFTTIIDELTNRALWEVKNVIDCIPEELWDKCYCEMSLWKHVYHMLHSLDQWYINPDCYEQPDFHTQDLNNLDAVTKDQLSRDTLMKYYDKIAIKIKEYNQSLTDGQLLIKPENSSYTSFTLILSQYRHLHSHMGMIMGFIIDDTGKWPRVLGLTNEFPVGNYEKYF